MDHDEGKAPKEPDQEFAEVSESLDDVFVAFDAGPDADPEDDLHDLLEKLEDVARTGGLIGSGAKGHRRALKKDCEVRNP